MTQPTIKDFFLKLLANTANITPTMLAVAKNKVALSSDQASATDINNILKDYLGRDLLAELASQENPPLGVTIAINNINGNATVPEGFSSILDAISSILNTTATLQSEIGELGGDIADLQGHETPLSARVSILEANATDFNTRITALETEEELDAVLDTRISNLETNVTALNLIVNGNNAAITQQTQAILGLNGVVNDQVNNLRELASTVAALDLIVLTDISPLNGTNIINATVGPDALVEEYATLDENDKIDVSVLPNTVLFENSPLDGTNLIANSVQNGALAGNIPGSKLADTYAIVTDGVISLDVLPDLSLTPALNNTNTAVGIINDNVNTLSSSLAQVITEVENLENSNFLTISSPLDGGNLLNNTVADSALIETYLKASDAANIYLTINDAISTYVAQAEFDAIALNVTNLQGAVNINTASINLINGLSSTFLTINAAASTYETMGAAAGIQSSLQSSINSTNQNLNGLQGIVGAPANLLNINATLIQAVGNAAIVGSSLSEAVAQLQDQVAAITGLDSTLATAMQLQESVDAINSSLADINSSLAIIDQLDSTFLTIDSAANIYETIAAAAGMQSSLQSSINSTNQNLNGLQGIVGGPENLLNIHATLTQAVGSTAIFDETLSKAIFVLQGQVSSIIALDSTFATQQDLDDFEASVNSSLNTLTSSIAAIEGLDSTLATIMQLQGAVDTINSSLAVIDSLDSTFATQDEIGTLQGEIDALTSTFNRFVNSTNENLNQLNAAASTYALEVDLLNAIATINSSIAEITGLDSTFATQDEIDTLQGEIDALTSSIAAIEGLDSTLATILQLQGAVDTINSSLAVIDSLDSTFATQDEIDTLQGEIDTLTSTVNGLDNNLNGFISSTNASLDDINSSIAAIEALDSTFATESELQGLQNALDGLTSTVNGISNDLSAFESSTLAAASTYALEIDLLNAIATINSSLADINALDSTFLTQIDAANLYLTSTSALDGANLIDNSIVNSNAFADGAIIDRAVFSVDEAKLILVEALNPGLHTSTMSEAINHLYGNAGGSTSTLIYADNSSMMPISPTSVFGCVVTNDGDPYNLYQVGIMVASAENVDTVAGQLSNMNNCAAWSAINVNNDPDHYLTLGLASTYGSTVDTGCTLITGDIYGTCVSAYLGVPLPVGM